LVFIAIAGFSVYFAGVALARHAAYASSAQDLGFFDQTIWASAHGHLLHFTVYDLNLTIPEHPTFLAYHVEPLLIAIAPLYRLWDDVRAILILQPIVLALAAVPAYRLGRYQLGSPWGGLAAAALLLLNPTLQAAAINDFHTLAFAPLLLLGAVLALVQRRWLGLAAWCGAAILVKEQISLLVVMLGLAALVDGLRHGWPGGRRQAVVGLGLMVVGAAWFLVAIAVVIPAAVGHQATVSPFITRYGQYGDSLATVVRTLLTRPDIVWAVTPKREVAGYWLDLALGGGLLPLVSPLTLLAAPEVAINSLSSFIAQRASATHYSLPIVPFVVAGAVDGAARLTRWRKVGWGPSLARSWHWPGLVTSPAKNGLPRRADAIRHAPLNSWFSIPVLLLALLVAGVNQADRGFLPGARKQRVYIAEARHVEAAAMLARIPATAAVMAQDNLVPHLTHRLAIYPFAYGFTPPRVGHDPPPDWVLLDVTRAEDRIDGRSIEREVYAAADYGVVAADNGYLLLRRGLAGKELPPAFTRFALADPAEIARPAHAESADGRLAYLGHTITWQPDPWFHRAWQATLTSYWRAHAPLDRDLRFVVGDAAGNEAFLFSLSPTAVWFPTSRWPAGQVVRVVHGTVTVNEPRALAIAALDPGPAPSPRLSASVVLAPPRAGSLAGVLDDLLLLWNRKNVALESR
jgi:uncharacterized membrane protein